MMGKKRVLLLPIYVHVVTLYLCKLCLDLGRSFM